MLASQGVRTSVRHVHNIKTGVGTTARGIHIPSHAHLHLRVPNLNQAHKLFTHSKHIITRFFNLLTAPGIRVPIPPNVGHAYSLNGAVHSYPTIQQGFSFSMRNTLGRSAHSPFLPRAPRPVPRSIAQVGLGTARNFSSTRPLFQNLIENVPVTGRAIYNADIDLKLRREKAAMRKPVKTSSTKQGGKEMLKPRARDFSSKENKRPSDAKREAELNKYFASPAADVTTCLLIPLAPTPTARVPLQENPGSLLPLPAIASIHNSHEIHSMRVSSLFSRLDAANVWERGVQCSAFSHGGGGTEGVCTMLKVEFVGWTKAEVRGVLGESGTGWCVLEEHQSSSTGLGILSDSDFEDSMSDTSSVLSGMFEDSRSASCADLTTVGTIDPSQSLFLPTLDFSSSFLEASSPVPTPQRPSRPSLMHSDPNFDPWLDAEGSSDGGLSRTSSWIEPPSLNGWNGFSSHFAEKVEATRS
ncbi:hypothetical protein H0H92_003296 [Tricholoma furcatifolium]|nr:hypothetical protein H0H92_003296 [Tricholoma furcatifolium]